MIRKTANKNKYRGAAREQPGESEPPKHRFQERPRVCLLDVEEEICEALKGFGFNCFVGTLGSIVEVPNRNRHDLHLCLLTCAFPPNLHEYDIVVVDLQNHKKVQYQPEDHTRSEVRGRKQLTLASFFPETIFDPRPMSAAFLKPLLQALLERETIFLIFAAENEHREYFPVEVTARGYERKGDEIHWTYDFFPELPPHENITGLDTRVVLSDNASLGILLRSHNDEAVYRIAFQHPTRWERETNKHVKDINFIPLMDAGEDRIVSFAYSRKKNSTLFFPQIEHKKEFVLDLFRKVLPELFPKVFPYSTQFAWLKGHLYRLPGEEVLLKEQRSLQYEYEKNMKGIEARIQANQERYQYLHDLLTQSGNELVKTVEEYFKWLGFANVFNADEEGPSVLQEDLQVETEGGLLVVEVKGVGGTSTDSECSQISKVKYRRARERDRFDVYALYVVNHQRFLPPEARTNPPFNLNQIQDAENDERGLLSTYDLFKLHFNIEAGLVTKEDARGALFQVGLITFTPTNAVKLPLPSDIYYDGYVIILSVEGTRVTTGMIVILDENGLYRESTIEEIQSDGKAVDEVESGEVGIRLADQVTKKVQLWLKMNS